MATPRKLSLPIPSFLLHHPRRPSQPQSRPPTPPSPTQLASARRASIQRATDFLHALIAAQPQWAPHPIRIDCPHTLSELHQLGHLPRDQGVRACRKLVRIPVLYDEIGVWLWMRLAEMARGGGGGGEEEQQQQQQQQQQGWYDAFSSSSSSSSSEAVAATTTAIPQRRESEPVSPGSSRKAASTSEKPSCSCADNNEACDHAQVSDYMHHEEAPRWRGERLRRSASSSASIGGTRWRSRSRSSSSGGAGGASNGVGRRLGSIVKAFGGSA